MGHIVDYFSEKENVDKREVEREIAAVARRNGDGWNGPMHWHPDVKPLKNYDEAEKWIQEHDKGWYDDHAVRYISHENVKPTKKMGEIQNKIQEIRMTKESYRLAHSVKNRKSEYIGCPECGSKLRREYLQSDHCPLCRTDLRSQTVLDALTGYDKRIKKAQEQLQEEKEKQPGEVRWLIKYEYHQ